MGSKMVLVMLSGVLFLVGGGLYIYQVHVVKNNENKKVKDIGSKIRYIANASTTALLLAIFSLLMSIFME